MYQSCSFTTDHSTVKKLITSLSLLSEYSVCQWIVATHTLCFIFIFLLGLPVFSRKLKFDRDDKNLNNEILKLSLWLFRSKLWEIKSKKFLTIWLKALKFQLITPKFLHPIDHIFFKLKKSKDYFLSSLIFNVFLGRNGLPQDNENTRTFKEPAWSCGPE